MKLSRSIHIDTAVKNTNNYIYVICKVLVYVQKSQPTTCFGLFQLGHLQVGHKGQRNDTKNAILSLKSGGDETCSWLRRDLVPPDFNDNIAFFV